MTATAQHRTPRDQLRSAVTGTVLEAGDPAVAGETTGANLTFAHTPAVVVGARSVDDITAAVRFADAEGRPVAVQGTGHGATGPIDGAVLVNTGRMRTVEIDPQARTARVEPGARWVDVLTAAQEHGLVGLVGSYTGVGVLGYTLGGGHSPVLGRRYGFAADQVRSFDIVTADGRLRRVDDRTEPDLFWAVRGGKGNFGVVTSLEFGLVPARRFYGGGIFLPWSAAGAVLHAFTDWSATLPDDASSSVALLRLPPDPRLPDPLRGQSVVHLRFSHLGSAEEGEQLLAPMRGIAPPVMDTVGELPFTAVDAVHMDPTDPLPFWYGGAQVHELPGDAVDAVLDVAAGPDVPLILTEIRRLGGALAHQPAAPNAVTGRDAAFSVLALGLMLPDLVDAVPRASAAVLRSVEPWSTGTALLNFAGCGNTPAGIRALFPPASRERLLQVKRDVDPRDMFRFGDPIGID